MTSRPFPSTAATIVALVLLAGCSGGFEQRELGPDSEVGRTISAMIETLRSEVSPDEIDGYIDEHGAGDLTDAQAAALRALLGELAAAERVELKGLDRFGNHVLRAELAISTPERTATRHALLVTTDDGPKWAGPN